MEKNILILIIIALVGIVGIGLLQANVLGSGFVAGIGYLLATLSIIVGIAMGMILK